MALLTTCWRKKMISSGCRHHHHGIELLWFSREWQAMRISQTIEWWLHLCKGTVNIPEYTEGPGFQILTWDSSRSFLLSPSCAWSYGEVLTHTGNRWLAESGFQQCSFSASLSGTCPRWVAFGSHILVSKPNNLIYLWSWTQNSFFHY